MKHNPQKSVQSKGETFVHKPIGDNQFNMHHTYPGHSNMPDVGRGSDEPDNIRRQKQDYFDNWEPRNTSSLS